MIYSIQVIIYGSGLVITDYEYYQLVFTFLIKCYGIEVSINCPKLLENGLFNPVLLHIKIASCRILGTNYCAILTVWKDQQTLN